MNKFILFIGMYWLSIDMLNGLFRYYLHIDFFAQIFRAIIESLFILFLFKYIDVKKNLFIIFFLLIINLFILNLYYLILNENINNIKMIFKIILPIIWYFIIYLQINNNILNYRDLKKIIILNTFLLLSNLYLFYFNIGFSNYGITENGLLRGGTGFFYAGNEVGITMLALFTLNLFIFYDKSYLYSFLLLILFVFGAIALMSKTAIFGIIFIYFIYLISKFNFFKLFIILLFVILIFIFYIYDFLLQYIDIMFNRWENFYNEYGMIYLLGGIKRWTEISNFISHLSFSEFLFGSGWKGYCENSFFDLFQGYGILGFFIYFLWVSIFFKLYKSKKINKKIFFISLSYLLILVVSFFAGHVVQSAMLSIFVAIIVNIDKIGYQTFVKGNKE